jgi:PTH1 family peptidyl-tRNA hydrolase
MVGLGNIGAECKYTHNGFKILDYFAKEQHLTVKLGALAEYKFKEEPFLLLKPNTYMNLSGSGTILDGQRKCSLENIFVITIDLNLSFSTIHQA